MKKRVAKKEDSGVLSFLKKFRQEFLSKQDNLEEDIDTLAISTHKQYQVLSEKLNLQRTMIEDIKKILTEQDLEISHIHTNIDGIRKVDEVQDDKIRSNAYLVKEIQRLEKRLKVLEESK